jgi:hypothetical protein
VESLPAWEKELCEGIDKSNKIGVMINAIGDPQVTIVLASDGGVKDKVGGFGWAMATEKGEVVWKHKGRARGREISSYRAEAYGMLSWMVYLRQFAKCFCEIRCKVKPYCDNEALVNESIAEEEWIKTNAGLRAEYDIIKAIHGVGKALRAEAPLVQHCRHVKGHQDKVIPWHILTLEAKMNVVADGMATKAIEMRLKKDEILEVTRNPYCKAYLLNDGATMTKDEDHHLRTKWKEFELQSYFMGKQNYEQIETLEDVNWAGIRIARDTKLMIGWLPTGRRLQWYGDLVTTCHRCGGEESADNLLRCGANEERR